MTNFPGALSNIVIIIFYTIIIALVALRVKDLAHALSSEALVYLTSSLEQRESHTSDR